MLSSLVAGVRAGLAELHRRPAHQIAGLDALRAAAVLLVIGDHYRANVWLPSGGDPEHWLATMPLTLYGWTGVDLFFVLSGFLIGSQVWRERQRTGAFRAWPFIVRRGLRIWPLYYATLVALAIGAGRLAPEWPDWLMVANYRATAYARSWSLATEEHFYIFLPLLLLCTPRWPLRRYGWVVVALWVATDVTRLARAGAYAAAGLDERAIDAALYSPFHLHNQGLLVGLLTALTVTLRPEWFRRAAGAGWSWWGFGVAAGMAALGLALRAANGLVFSYTALALVYGGALLFVLLDRSWVVRLTAAWAWYPIARLSYGMYLNHLIFGAALTRGAVRALRAGGAHETLVYAGGLALAIALSAGIALFTFLAIERPFLALRDRHMPHRAPASPAAATPATPSDTAVGAAG